MKVQSKFNYGSPVYSIKQAIEQDIITDSDQINKLASLFGKLVEELYRRGSMGKKGVLRLLPLYEEVVSHDND